MRWPCAFPNLDDLRLVVMKVLNEPLQRITMAGNMPAVVLDLIEFLSSHGPLLLDDFVQHAYRDRPGNTKLRVVAWESSLRYLLGEAEEWREEANQIYQQIHGIGKRLRGGGYSLQELVQNLAGLPEWGDDFILRVPLFDFVELLCATDRGGRWGDGRAAAPPLAVRRDQDVGHQPGPAPSAYDMARGSSSCGRPARIWLASSSGSAPLRPTIPSRVVSCSTASRRGCSAWTGRGSFGEARGRRYPDMRLRRAIDECLRGTGAAGRPARPVPDGVDVAAQPARPGV